MSKVEEIAKDKEIYRRATSNLSSHVELATIDEDCECFAGKLKRECFARKLKRECSGRMLKSECFGRKLNGECFGWKLNNECFGWRS